MSRLGAVADAYARGQVFARAAPVFPVAGKRPLTPRGFHDASADLDQVAAWWRRWPQAGIGLPTGRRTGLVVLDLDGPEAADWYRERLRGRARPLTPIARTPRGGWHVVFARPREGVVRCSTAKLGPGVDVRGEGGYVVAWPSRTDAGRWRWWPGHEPWRVGLAPCPPWMIELQQDRPRPTAPQPRQWVAGEGTPWGLGALREECAEVVEEPQGSRNERLNLAAFKVGQLVGAGHLDAGFAADWLVRAGLGSGLSEHETRGTVRSGLTAGLREPRQVAS